MMDPLVTVTTTVRIDFGGLSTEGYFTMTVPLSGLVNAQNADTALQTEIAQYLTDVATRIAAALASTGDSDAAVQQIANDLLADAQTLQNADPLAVPGTCPAGYTFSATQTGAIGEIPATGGPGWCELTTAAAPSSQRGF
jgi:hypothetical protein